jgi:putative SbcD/Mre11-related phosphoesterase
MSDLPITDAFIATPHRFLWHPATATAILSDVHLGAEAELTRRGIFMPDVSIRPLYHAWNHLLLTLSGQKQSRLIIAGDLFDTPNPGTDAVDTAIALFEALPPSCRITLIPGNHDPAAPVLARMFHNLPLTVADAASVGGYTVIHGHEAAPPNDPQLGFIVGHQHPAVTVRNRVQSAKMICYALVILPRTGKRLILLPTFSRAPLGTNLAEYNWILNFPRPSNKDVQILGIIEGDKSQVLDFGSLASLRLPF